MKLMNNKLEALQQYLKYVKTFKNCHSWGSASKCHCGMLLKSLDLFNYCDISCAFNTALINEIEGVYYGRIFNLYKTPVCEVTYLPFTEVVNELVNIGFTVDELVNLEELQDTRFGTYENFDSVDALIEYLQNWIKYEEQIVKCSTKDTVTVAVTGL